MHSGRPHIIGRRPKRSLCCRLYTLLMAMCITLCGTAITTNTEWIPDRFLAGYEETTVRQPSDYSGDVVCTVVRKLASDSTEVAVLYVHGYNDYFFQAQEGDRFVEHGYDFYAVDLRKYGRSLLNGQTPYEARKISEYYADINAALDIIRASGVKEVVLMGHSTGGLVVASYMNNRPQTIVKAVILNSPFLDWNMSWFMRKILIPIVTWVGGWWPKLSISQGDGTAYAESLLKRFHGEWDYDTNLKTIHPRKVTAGWIRAISKAQQALRKKSDIRVPVLLMRSDNSVNDEKWSARHQHGDAVLNVEHISAIGRKLGPQVTEDVVEGGLHDLALSAPAVRNRFYADIFAWLDQVLPKN